MAKIEFWTRAENSPSMQLVGVLFDEMVPFIVAQIEDAAEAGGSRGEVVVVISVDADRPQKFPGLKEVSENQAFPSAMFASRYLGFTFNAVAQALGKDRLERHTQAVAEYGQHHTQAVRPEAKLRGVTLQYERDLKD